MLILGVGSFGALVHHLALKNDINIEGFIDLNELSELKCFLGKDVYKLENVPRSSDILIASNRWNRGWIERQYGRNRRLYYPEQLIPNFRTIKEVDVRDLQGVTWSNRKVVDEIANYFAMVDILDPNSDPAHLKIPTLDIEVTQRCSLKCEDCSNLMQYYLKPVDPESSLTIASLEKILHVCDVGCIRIIGGEPLLAKDLGEYLSFLSGTIISKDQRIEIYTNGTILPSPDILKICQSLPLTFYISNYGELSRKLVDLVSLLEDNDIDYTIENNLVWQDCGKVRDYSVSNIDFRYSNCCVAKTFSVMGSRLYSCPFSANFHSIYKEESISTRDYIDLSSTSVSDLYTSIRSMFLSQSPLSACYFCSGRDYSISTVEVAKQTRQILSR